MPLIISTDEAVSNYEIFYARKVVSAKKAGFAKSQNWPKKWLWSFGSFCGNVTNEKNIQTILLWPLFFSLSPSLSPSTSLSFSSLTHSGQMKFKAPTSQDLLTIKYLAPTAHFVYVSEPLAPVFIEMKNLAIAKPTGFVVGSQPII